MSGRNRKTEDLLVRTTTKSIGLKDGGVDQAVAKKPENDEETTTMRKRCE